MHVHAHVRIRTCESRVIFDVLTRMGDTCHCFFSAVVHVLFNIAVCDTCVCVDDAR